jgi:RNA polymerase sigma factor (sigma-70 family)
VQVPDDDNPLDGLIQHSDAWWTAVYKHYACAAYNGALSVYPNKAAVKDAADVQDVVQGVFEELIDKKGIDNTTKSIGAVLYRAARNRALDRVKRQRHTADGEVEDRPATETGFDEVEDDDERVRVGGIAWDNLHRLNDRERRVWAALGRKEPHEQIAIREGISRARVSQLSKDIPRKLLRGSGLLPDERRGDEL